MTRARARLVLTGAARRRIFGEYQSSEPSRFIDEVPAELVERIAPSFSSSSGYQGNFPHYEFRTNPYGRGGAAACKEAEPTYAYEDEDQSTGIALRLGHEGAPSAVRHRHRAERRARSTTTRSWWCGSRPSARRRCARNTRASNQRRLTHRTDDSPDRDLAACGGVSSRVAGVAAVSRSAAGAADSLPVEALHRLRVLWLRHGSSAGMRHSMAISPARGTSTGWSSSPSPA